MASFMRRLPVGNRTMLIALLLLVKLPWASRAQRARCPVLSGITSAEVERKGIGLPGKCQVRQSNSSEPIHVPIVNPAKADIIIAIDTSGSMAEETKQVMDNINLFGQYLEVEGIDYRVVLVGESSTCCSLCVKPPLAPTDCALEGPRFRQVTRSIDSFNMLAILSDGLGGRGVEAGEDYDLTAYEDLICNSGDSTVANPVRGICKPRSQASSGEIAASDAAGLTQLGYASFLRPEASKTFVIVTDDANTRYFSEKQNCAVLAGANTFNKDSPCVNDFIDTVHAFDIGLSDPAIFNKTKRQPEGFVFHTIDGNDCPAAPGYQRSWLYNKLAERTGGSKFKLCNSDWTGYFVDIANAVRDSVDVIDCDYDVPRDAADPDNFFLGRLPLDTPFDVQYQYALKQEIAAGQQEELYAAPPNANCPDGTNIIDIDFDDSGRTNTQGTLVYTGSHGFKVYFTDDKSGPKGGVEITNQQSGNCIVANNCNAAQLANGGGNVLGANDDVGTGTDQHSSGIVAVFNQGATRVSFMDMDDDDTKKSVFAYAEDGTFIGQSQPASQQEVSIDTSMTGGRLIYSLEFDTEQGTDGGFKDGTVFTIDNFHAEGLCEQTQVRTNGLIPCIKTCVEDEFVEGCINDQPGTCTRCSSLPCDVGYSRVGCGGFGKGSCIRDGQRRNLTLVQAISTCPDGNGAAKAFRDSFFQTTCPSLEQNLTGFFTVDNPDNPRRITFCEDMCAHIRSLPSHAGELGFQFKPITRLTSVTVSGRGPDATAALINGDQKIRPAVGSASESVQDFYKLSATPADKGTGLSGLFPDPDVIFSATGGKGIALFFFADGQGQSWFGFQFGEDSPGQMSHAILNVIVSGTTTSSLLGAPWKVQNGDDFSLRVDWNTEAGGFRVNSSYSRVETKTSPGKTAGGMLGPLPASGFCLDLDLIEYSSNIDRVTLVDFASFNGAYDVSLGKESRLPMDVFVRGGFRMCADSCSGEANATALRCKAGRSGGLNCYTAQELLDAQNRLPDDYGDLFDDDDDNDDGNGGGQKAASPSGSSGGGSRIGVSGENGTSVSDGAKNVLDKDGAESEGGDGSSSLTGWFVGGGCMLLCGVMIALAVVSMRRKSRREAEAASVAMTGGKGIELSGHTRSRTEYWVPPPPTPTAAGVAAAGGAVNSKNPLFGGATSKGLSGESVGSPAATNKKRRRKRPGERKSQMSAGFAEFRKVKRASTFEKFREMRGLRRKSSTNDTKNPVKKRGPSVMNVAHSDWDAFFSDEHKCDYYHNRKTGETRWTTPPEVLAKLESRGGGVAGSAGDTGSAVIAKAAGRGFGEPHVAIALGDVAFSGAKVGGGQPTAAAATWKAFSSEKGTYYCNTVTQEVSWVLPAGAKLEGEGTGGGLTQVNVEANFLHSSKRKKLEKEYVEYQTEDGKTAYHNTRTGEVSWVNPYKACAAYKPDLTAKQFGVCATCGFFKKEHGGK